jgi:HPt (histidine-containing phosphotransfer) domain-containing protein
MSTKAGCDAHLSKPISKAKLLAAIETYGRRHGATSKTGNSIPIRMPEGLEELVPPYLSSRRQEIPELKKMLADGDFTRLSVVAHNLKGAGQSYGFSDLTRLGRDLEESAHSADDYAVRGLLDQLGDYLERVQLVS